MARAPSCAIWNEKAPRRMRTYNVVTSESRRQIVSRADDVVKQSVHACHSSLQLDKKRRSKTVSSCSFSNLLSIRDALNCIETGRLTGCPARVVSPSCPIFPPPHLTFVGSHAGGLASPTATAHHCPPTC